jgi:hypothetical protein
MFQDRAKTAPRGSRRASLFALANRIKLGLLLGAILGRFWSPLEGPKTLMVLPMLGSKILVFWHVIIVTFQTQKIVQSLRAFRQAALLCFFG